MTTSQARIDANRRNAQSSTGPRTPEGKSASAKNATKHGLTRSIEHANQLAEDDQKTLAALREKYHHEFKIQGELEEDLLTQYAWNLFMVQRANSFEAVAMNSFDTDPTEQRFKYLERVSAYRTKLERALAKSKKELATAQADRFAANGPNTVLEYQALDHKMSSVLPSWEIRRATFRKSNQFHFAAQVRDGLPDDTPRLPFEKPKSPNPKVAFGQSPVAAPPPAGKRKAA
jgi:uncharacterized protein (DUF2132 family)